MKRTLLPIAIVALALFAGAAAPASERVTILLAGGPEADAISISLSPDGRTYTIVSAMALEVGGEVCSHPSGAENELVCAASAITGFEVGGGGGDDMVTVARDVPVAVTLRGGPGDDHLAGAAGSDRLVGGAGDDVLVGRAGGDQLYGGPGEDRLHGGPGEDLLRGEAGQDVLFGGSGENRLIPG